jgi:hypothetical protein
MTRIQSDDWKWRPTALIVWFVQSSNLPNQELKMLTSFPVAMTPVNRNWRAERSPVDRARDEQEFYEQFAGDKPHFDWTARVGAAVILCEFVLAIGGFIVGWR